MLVAAIGWRSEEAADYFKLFDYDLNLLINAIKKLVVK